MRRDIEDLDNVNAVSKAQLNGNNHYAIFTIIQMKVQTLNLPQILYMN